MRKVRKPKELYETMTEALSLFEAHPEKTTVEIAKAVGMSLSRFEHAFSEWVGTTPRRYRNYLKNREVKEKLQTSKNILRSTYASGLKSPARLGELLVTYDAITPSEARRGDIQIKYGVHTSPFGHCLIAVTERGICQIAFLDKKGDGEAVQIIREKWPEALIQKDEKQTKQYVDQIFARKHSKKPLHLLVKGTNFQIKVWEALLSIPEGQTSTYTAIAKAIGKGKAVRAVGTACGKNAIAYLIPCHRVLTSGGSLGGYHWGLSRKRALLAREEILKA